MEIQTSAQLAVKEAMSVTGCRTQEELAERVGVSQNAIWKLLNGKSKTAKYKTARAFEKATNGVVSRFRFLEEQGTTEQESQDGSTDASSDDAQATACPRSTVSSASSQRTDTHGGIAPLVGG